MNDSHFPKIFWFVCFLCGFAAMLTLLIIFVPIPRGNERFADQALVFWLTTGAGGGIGFLIGNSYAKSRAQVNQQASTVINNTGETPAAES